MTPNEFEKFYRDMEYFIFCYEQLLEMNAMSPPIENLPLHRAYLVKQAKQLQRQVKTEIARIHCAANGDYNHFHITP